MVTLPGEWDAYLAVILLVLLFLAFLTERYPPDVTATGAAALFIVFGLVPREEALAVFSNAAPITIAAMFVISGSLVRTGLLDAIANVIINGAVSRPILSVAGFFIAALVASAFVNNTPVVIVLIPVVVRLARSIGLAPTRLLIPLSYAAILGGTVTLIGTSTNLLVGGVAQSLGLEPFGIFEIAPVGIICAIVGGGTLVFLGPWLLPARTEPAESFEGEETEYLTEATVQDGAAFIGRPLTEVAEFRRSGIKLLGVRSGGAIKRDLAAHPVAKGDTVVMTATTSELLTLRRNDSVRIGMRQSVVLASGVKPIVAEAIVAPRSGRERIANLAIGQRFGMRVLGAFRQNHIPGEDLATVLLRPADKLLLEGPAESFEQLAKVGDLVAVTRPAGRAYRRGKAPLALTALAGVVILAATGAAPIELLALVAVAAILVLRCIDNDEAWQSINASILVLIFAMLVIGAGLEATGAVELIVAALQPFLSGLPPVATLAMIYVTTSILTEIVTNNAVAVVLTPIAVALATQLGIDPRAFVVAVMMAASASFATPIGYQTNTLVYGAGAYRFTDFLKVGVPMNVTVGVAAILAIPVFFPLDGG